MGDDIEFSGGEKQIIAFIRVLLQDRDIIIMDEGTNQLDAENEVLVMSELMQKKSNKIIIFITHRMSTISRADMIYCLE
jgi:ABC-type bacteriocin/lantibiotic exporter with double-glycine peptidase domain